MVMSVAVLPHKRRVIVTLNSAEHRVSLALQITDEVTWHKYLEVNIRIGEERGMGEGLACWHFKIILSGEREFTGVPSFCHFVRGTTMSRTLRRTSVIFSDNCVVFQIIVSSTCTPFLRDT